MSSMESVREMDAMGTEGHLPDARARAQLETLYDLALALYADRPEGELVEELLQQVCAVLDPATAAAVTRGRREPV